MGNIILICILVFLALMTFIGYRRGLIKTIFSLISVVLMLVVVTVLTPTARMIIRHTPLYPYVQEKVEEYVDLNVEKDSEQNIAVGIGVNEQKKVINELPLPENFKEELVENNTEDGYQLLDVSNFSDYLVQYITDMIINAIAFIVLFIIVVVAIKAAIILLDIVSKLPGVNFFNKGGGALFGFVEAMLMVWILCIVIEAFSATTWGQRVFLEINENVFLSLIYNNNILENIIFGFF